MKLLEMTFKSTACRHDEELIKKVGFASLRIIHYRRYIVPCTFHGSSGIPQVKVEITAWKKKCEPYKAE